jgi:RNA polymerase sigma factor (sigma-70 family)
VIVTPDLLGPPDGDAAVIHQSVTEPEQFKAIFARYFREVHAYLARRVGGKVADDLTAEVFLAAFAKRQRYDAARESARPWLYGIATNLISTHRRHERRFYSALARTGVVSAWHDDEDRIADRVSASATGPALARALAALAPGDRDVLLLIALAELSYQEVADALAIPYGTVCSRLNRARRQLRKSLGGVNPVGDQHQNQTSDTTLRM